MIPERPDRKVLSVWLWSNALSYGAVILISLLVWAVFRIVRPSPAQFWWLLVPGGFATLWGLTTVTLRRQWEAWTFRVTPDALEMCHGWLWRNRRVVARDLIQHLDLNSGPFDRRFGLVQVVVHTAGTNVGFIPGLTPERAERLRDELLADRAVTL